MVVLKVPLRVMLSFAALPRTTSPFKVVVVFTVKSPVMVPSTFTVKPCIVLVVLTVSPPLITSLPDTVSKVMEVVAKVLVPTEVKAP